MVQKLVRTGYPENHQVSFFWNFWKLGRLFEKNQKLQKNQAGSLGPLKEPELPDLTKKWEPPNAGTDPSNPNNGMIPTLHNQKVDTGYNK
jgi:hypothetical protein